MRGNYSYLDRDEVQDKVRRIDVKLVRLALDGEAEGLWRNRKASASHGKCSTG